MVSSMRDLLDFAFASTDTTLRESLRGRMPGAAAGAEVENARNEAAGFGRYDGVIQDERLAGEVRQRFNEKHVFSVNQLETWLDCPFRFFAERILKLEPVEEPAAEFDPRVRGIILHKILERFHKHFAGVPAAHIPEAEALETAARMVDEVFERYAAHSATAPDGVSRVEKLRMADTVERYLKVERENGDTQWRSLHFEVDFGLTPSESEQRDPVSVEAPFEFDADGEQVLFSGRIDRVDKNDDNAARIVDYKTTLRVQPKDIKEGRSIQLIVYALALERLVMPGVQCREAIFVQPGIKKRIESLGHDNGKFPWAERLKAAQSAVSIAVNGIRNAEFPPTPAAAKRSCAYCPVKRVCRWEKSRIDRKLHGGPDG